MCEREAKRLAKAIWVLWCLLRAHTFIDRGIEGVWLAREEEEERYSRADWNDAVP